MSVLTRLLEPKKLRATLKDNPIEAWLADVLGVGEKTVSGERVSPRTAITLSGYFAAVRAIAEDVAKVPRKVYERIPDGGKRPAEDSDDIHTIYRIIHDRPNPNQTPMMFWSYLILHALNWGGGFAYIDRRKNGQVQALYPVSAEIVSVEWDTEFNGPVYWISDPKRGRYPLWPDAMFHVPGVSFDGLNGVSIPKVARESLGLALATDKSGAAVFGNALMPSGILQVPYKLKPEAKQNLRETFREKYTGAAEKAHQFIVLEGGVEFKPLSMSHVDTQWIESRKLSVVECARWLRIPPHKLQDLGRATWNNLGEQNIEYYCDTLQPWFLRIEQECDYKLLRPLREVPGRSRFFVEHVIEGLLRGNIEQQYRAFATARQWGWMTTNDIRRVINMNPVGPEGDILLTPANMQNSVKLLIAKPSTEPAEEEPEETEESAQPKAGDLRLLAIAQQKKAIRNRENDGEVIKHLWEVYETPLRAAWQRLLRFEQQKWVGGVPPDKASHWAANFYGPFANRSSIELTEWLAPFMQSAWYAEYGTSLDVARIGDFVGECDRIVRSKIAERAEYVSGRGRLPEADNGDWLGMFRDMCWRYCAS